jgi:hypothetical protein
MGPFAISWKFKIVSEFKNLKVEVRNNEAMQREVEQ